jgi:50S ribosomal protein L16 3-hydroxylase
VQEIRPVLRRWLDEVPLTSFLRHHLGRQPIARPSSAADAIGLFGWRSLDRLLRRPGLDVLAIRDGRERKLPAPRSLEEARRLLDVGVGLVLRRAERHDAALEALGRSLARDLPGQVRIQLFVTAGATSGFGWHYDAEEVFIVQTGGEKDYYFRRNTIDPAPVPGTKPDFGRIREERTPTMTSTLLPGDWLYLPRGWWHAARARTDSLSISLGVTLADAASSRS